MSLLEWAGRQIERVELPDGGDRGAFWRLSKKPLQVLRLSEGLVPGMVVEKVTDEGFRDLAELLPFSKVAQEPPSPLLDRAPVAGGKQPVVFIEDECGDAGHARLADCSTF